MSKTIAAIKKECQEIMDEKQAEIADLKKQVEMMTSAAGYNATERSRLNEEVEQIHAVLDAMPGSIKRQKDDGFSTHSAVTRFAAWLANR